jgi:hypothetical protein
VQSGFSADPIFLAAVLVDLDAADVLEIIEVRAF